MQIIIKPKDVQRIFNCSYTTARSKLQAVRDSLNVKIVTVTTFCKEFGIPENEIRKVLE